MEIASFLLPDDRTDGIVHSPIVIFLAAVTVLGVVVLIDAITYYEIGFSAFYVIPVLIATWGVGTTRGLGFALVSACCWYCVDLTSGRPLSNEMYRIWDGINHLLSYSLVAVITGTLKLAFRREQALRESLDTSLQNVRELEGLLPVCAWCKKIRDDEGYWLELESYLRPRTKADFSHGICPECAAKELGLKLEDIKLEEKA